MGRIARIALSSMLLLVLLAGYAAAQLPGQHQLPEHPAEAFQPSSGCGCHAGFVDDWRNSMHSQALDDPLYLTKLAQAEEEAGPEVVRFCEDCHGAVAAMAGELDDRVFSEQGGEGVTCDLCHQTTGTLDPIGNTSLIVDPDGTKRGRFGDSESPAHDTTYSEFHTTAEFCGMCHNVDHPVNGLPIEATYTEWSESPYAAEGIVCQDCHMTPGPGVTKPNPGRAAAGGPDRDHIYRMTFVGGNVALGNAALAEERLQAAAEIELDVDELVPGGSQVPATVRITNVGAGHYLPTGLTDFRRMWVEFTATDAEGNETELGRREFHTVFKDADGNHPVEMWDAVDFQSDDRIPPRESVEETWDVAMPQAGPLTLTATLYYRSCTEEFAEKAGVDVPTTTMTSAQTVLYTSEAERQEARSVEPGEGYGFAGDRHLLWILAGAAILIVGGLFLAVRLGRKGP